jgi:hypothetical protein
MAVKIRVKLGEVEIECEGSEAFVKTDLLVIARDLIRLSAGAHPVVESEDVDVDGVPESGPSAASTPDHAPAEGVPAEGVPATDVPGTGVSALEDVSTTAQAPLPLGMSEVAYKLGVKSGSDLLVAAAAYHAFALASPTFDRGDLLSTMRLAPDHYKRSYTNNLSGYISTLVRRGVFVETLSDTYTLAPATQEELATRLADG